jgi:hypothetical protein
LNFCVRKYELTCYRVHLKQKKVQDRLLYVIMPCLYLHVIHHQHSRPGRGALTRLGEYWYPVRLLQKIQSTSNGAFLWDVQLWPHCHLKEPWKDRIPTTVHADMLIDELQGDKEARRLIRVCTILCPKYMITHTSCSLDDGKRHI